MAKSRTKAALNSGAATNNGQLIAQKRGSYFSILLIVILVIFICQSNVYKWNNYLFLSMDKSNYEIKGLDLIKSLFNSSV